MEATLEAVNILVSESYKRETTEVRLQQHSVTTTPPKTRGII